MHRKNRLQYFAVTLGWVYTGLLLGLAMGAAFSPGHTLVLYFRCGTLYVCIWADNLVSILQAATEASHRSNG